jgi:hypothetical protein
MLEAFVGPTSCPAAGQALYHIDDICCPSKLVKFSERMSPMTGEKSPVDYSDISGLGTRIGHGNA